MQSDWFRHISNSSFPLRGKAAFGGSIVSTSCTYGFSSWVACGSVWHNIPHASHFFIVTCVHLLVLDGFTLTTYYNVTPLLGHFKCFHRFMDQLLTKLAVTHITTVNMMIALSSVIGNFKWSPNVPCTLFRNRQMVRRPLCVEEFVQFKGVILVGLKVLLEVHDPHTCLNTCKDPHFTFVCVIFLFLTFVTHFLSDLHRQLNG